MKRTVLAAAVAVALLLLAGCGGSNDAPRTETQPRSVEAESAMSNLPVPVELGVPFVVRDSSGVDQARVTFKAVELDPECTQSPSLAVASARGHYVSVEMEVETLPQFSSARFGVPSGLDFEVRDDSGFGDKAAETSVQRCFRYEQIFNPMTGGGRYRGVVLLDTKRGASELVYRPMGFLGVPGWILKVDALAGDAPPVTPLGRPANEYSAPPMYRPSIEPMPTIVPPTSGIPDRPMATSYADTCAQTLEYLSEVEELNRQWGEPFDITQVAEEFIPLMQQSQEWAAASEQQRATWVSAVQAAGRGKC